MPATKNRYRLVVYMPPVAVGPGKDWNPVRYAWYSPTMRSPIDLDHTYFIPWDEEDEGVRDYFLTYDSLEDAEETLEKLRDLNLLVECDIAAIEPYPVPVVELFRSHVVFGDALHCSVCGTHIHKLHRTWCKNKSWCTEENTDK